MYPNINCIVHCRVFLLQLHFGLGFRFGVYCVYSVWESYPGLKLSCRVQQQSSAMARHRIRGRLPLEHLGRQRDRDRKLLEREITRARFTGVTRLRCPCRICNRGVRTWYSLKTMTQHIRDFGYHPWQRGPSEVNITNRLRCSGIVRSFFPLC